MGTLNKPGKYDCYSKLEPDEPHFVLMGRDPVAWILVPMWCAFREQLTLEPEKQAEAMECALAMRKWAIDHGKAELVDKISQLLSALDPTFADLIFLIDQKAKQD